MSKDPTLKCPLCGKQCRTIESYRRHVKKHMGG